MWECRMFNIGCIFEEAIRSVEKYSDEIGTPALPATVHMLQNRVLEAYRHALFHYLYISLDEDYLQGSSYGTPYRKWMIVNKENFVDLNKKIKMLANFTIGLQRSAGYSLQSWSERKDTCVDYNALAAALEDLNCFIGLSVLPNEKVVIHAYNPQVRYLSHGMWCCETLRRIDICDRSILKCLVVEGKDEVAELIKLNKKFFHVCENYYQHSNVMEPYNERSYYWDDLYAMRCEK